MLEYKKDYQITYYGITMSLLRKRDRVITPINKESPLKRVKKIVTIERYCSKPLVRYRHLVKLLTEKNVHLLKGIEKRQFRVCDVDHKISVSYGFKHNIAPYCIAHISNLRLISNKDNFIKGDSNFIDDDNKWIVE